MYYKYIPPGIPTRSRTIIYVVALTGVACLVVRMWFRRPPIYIPLINFQNLNPPPLLSDISSSSPADRAVISSLYSDPFAVAVAVLGHSLRRANVSAQFLLHYLEGRVSDRALCIARAAGWDPLPVPFISPPHNGTGIDFRFHDQYTKLNLWGIDKLGIHQAVYLDADTLVMRNFEELFDIPFNFAAVPDVFINQRGFTLDFNAGVLALHPSSQVLDQMKSLINSSALSYIPPHDAEQGFLNAFFATHAVRLPYAYNANLAIKVKSPAVWEAMREELKIVHYTLVKPFLDREPGFESPEILKEEPQREASEQAKKLYEGLFAEEISWWQEAYDDMMDSLRTQIQTC